MKKFKNTLFWFLAKTYTRLFQPESLFIRKTNPGVFKVGERIIGTTRDRDLYYLGGDFYFKPNSYNKDRKIFFDIIEDDE